VSDIDPRRYLLPEAESLRIFRNEIVPDELARGVSQEKPVVVFVAAQPGAGKTRTTATIKDQLDQRGGAIVVNSDFYKPYHPEYSRLLATDDRNAAPYTSMDGRRWMALAEQYLIEHRVDTIIETTMRDPGDFAEPAAMFRAAGYRVEAAIMAVPEPLSRLGIVHRYHEQVQQLGHGRLTARSNHDASYQGVMAAAETIDRDRIVDVATVYRRGNVQLAINYLDPDGQWHWPNRSIAQSIDTERRRAWTPGEIKVFAETVGRLAAEMGPEWHDELRDITSRAIPLTTTTPDTARAAAAALGFPQSTRDALGTSLGREAPSPHRTVTPPGPEQDRGASR
jgi:UDP-N-acetylglucosamine kinase